MIRPLDRYLAARPDDRCFIDGQSMRISAVLLSLVMTFAPVATYAQSVPPGVTRIVPDGRTQTTVTTSGSVSTVTTSTVSGPNAFNSFSQFEIGRGATGNLVLPNGTSNLINLMTGNDPAVINGIMNSYKNGQIGGNVYFASPKGFVVGRSGIVNVGSLNVTTPTREFVDSVIGPSGQINQGAVNNLLAGTVPISPDGNIRIRGRVNAVDAVRLTGQNVLVGSQRDAVNRDHAIKFASTVNSRGLRSANSIVVRNGSIQIVAADRARVNGRLSTASKTGKAGDITISARDIMAGPRAKLSAASTAGDAGKIIIFADNNLEVKSGAQIDVSSTQGNGGFVDLSARNTVTLGAIRFKLAAPNGTAGTVLVDPDDIVITGDGQSYGTGNSLYSDGGNIILTASDSITVTATGVIDSRAYDRGQGDLSETNVSTGNSGNITLNAPNITVLGKILADVINDGTSYTAGDVTLNAIASVNQVAGLVETATSIDIGGNALIKGRNIALNSNATAISSYTDSVVGILALIGQSAAASVIGLNGGYVAGTATATINVRDNATIDGTGNVNIASSAKEVASDPALSIGGALPVTVAVTVGEIVGTVETTIGSGTHVYAGGDLKITSQNDAHLNVLAIGLSDDQFVPTVAYGTASVNTSTTVETGADLKTGGNLYVGAQNINSFNVSATSYSIGQTGKAGVAIAYSDVNTKATAKLGANVGAAGAPIAGSVTVEANSGMPNSTADATNTTSSTAVAGNSILIDLIAKGAASFTQKKFTDFVAAKAPSSSRSDLKFAGALSLTFSDQSATAAIENTGTTGAAPSINAAGNVAVVAKVSDVGVSSLADASTNSQEIADPDAASTQSQAKKAVAFGVAIGNYGHHANAYIGQDVAVCCANLGVSATIEMPITITWLTYDNLGTWLGKFNGNLGTVNEVLTSYANAASQAQDATKVGAANYFAVDNSATAWIGEGATITRDSTTPAAPWSTALVDGSSVAWDQAIAVQAATRTASINIGGNFSWVGLTGSSGQQNEAGHSRASAIGGAVNVVSYTNNTIAGISDDVTVNSNGGVGVNARNENVVFSVSPTSGAGNDTSYNGIVALGLIDDVAHASISNSARITAPSVDIGADEILSIFSVGGVVASSQTTAVGVVVAVNQIQADTAAYIGDNRADIAGSRDAANDPGTASSVTGYVYTDGLQLDAQSYGIVTAASVAATEASGSSNSTGSTFLNKFISLLKTDSAQSKADSKADSAAGTTTPKTSLSIAGSSSVNISEVNTTAYISGAVIDKKSAAGRTSVQAVNNTIQQTGAGSAAFDMAKVSSGGQAGKSAAVAGALAINISGNATRAYVDNSTISNTRAFSALALSGGEQTTVALGLAINNSADKDKAASVAGSVSIAIVTDLVDAHVSGSAITVDPALTSATLGYTDAFIVSAYQTTDVGVGGGSLYFGGKTGFGFALTYTEIGDPDGLKAVNAHVTNSTVTGFFNATVGASYAGSVGAGAGLFGYQKGNGGTGVGFGVSLVITDIGPTVDASIDGGSVVRVAGISQMSPVVYASTLVSTTELTDTADTDYTETGRFVNPLDPNVTFYSYDVAHTVMELRHGDVTVSSNGTRIAAFDSAIANAARTGGSLINTGLVDFSGAAIAAEGTNSGASITAVAGLIQGGANSVGFAITASTIHQTNRATIDHASVTSDNGDVVVTADSSADILGIAVGIAVSDGKFAGLASSSINLIDNTVSATVGGTGATPANTTVDATNLVVRATDNADIRGAAGTLGIGLGNAAAGLSVTYDQIGNSVTAAISGAKVDVGNDVLLNAASNADILSIAIGIAVSKNVGIAGSVVTNISDTNVTARIDGGADVTAANNIGVIADNTDTMKVVAGALGVGLTSAGVGISVVVNDVKGATTATIAGSGTKVDAYATGGSALSVNSGALAHSFDVSTADNPNLDIPDLSELQRTVSGVAVVASSHQAVVGVDVTIGLSAELLTGDALALAPVTSLMGGSTTASIDGAQVGTRLANSPSATAAPQIFVGAGSLSYSRNLVIAGSGAGGFSGAGAIAANRMERATHAFITDAQIGSSTRSVGDVAINAAATQIASDIAVGLAVGVAGAGASIIVNVFSADTQAYLTHGALYASNLLVNALSTESYFAAGGAAAVNFLGGFAGAFVVGATQNTTKAYIGDDDAGTSVNLANDLTVNAQSDNTFYSYAIGGSAAGTGAVAGMVDFTVVNNHTEATIRNVTDTQTEAGSDVNVSALETVTIRPTAGAGAVGLSGAGIGASINVVLLKSQVASGIVDSTLDAKGAVNVLATSNKDIDMQTVTFGAGGSVGIAASISLLLAGRTAPGDAADQINASVSAADGASSGIPADNGIESDDVPGSANPAPDRPPSYSLADALGSANDAVTAEITGGSTKADAVRVEATANVKTKNTASGVGIGGTVGVGAALGYSLVYDTVIASVEGDVTSDKVDVLATMQDNSGHAVEVNAYAGAGSLGAAVGAGVAIGTINNTVAARLGGKVTGSGVGTTANKATVSALDSSSVSTQAVGAAIAAGALGVSASVSTKSSLVYATVPEGAVIDGYSTLKILATGRGAVSSDAIAGAGGVVAGSGAGAESTDNEHIIAEVGTAAIQEALTGNPAPSGPPAGGAPKITVGLGDPGDAASLGALEVHASGTPEATASAVGVSVGAAGVGASVAKATVNPTVTALVDSYAQIITAPVLSADTPPIAGYGKLMVFAETLVPASTYSAKAFAVAGTGGYLIGANATDSEAKNDSFVRAAIGDHVVLPVGNIEIKARNNTSEYADTTGIAVGYIALGVAVALTTANATTQAAVGNSVTSDDERIGSLSISAIGTDTVAATATSGVGGVIAGNGAGANTTVNANVGVSIGDDADITAGILYLGASHATNYKARVSSVNASLAGASGAAAVNDLDSNVTVDIGKNTKLMALSNACGSSSCLAAVTLIAENDFAQIGSGDSATGAGGGVLNGSAVEGNTKVRGHTTITVADGDDAAHGTTITAGTDPFNNPGGIRMTAFSTLNAQDTVSLETGGAITAAGVNTTVDAEVHNDVTVGNFVQLKTFGSIGLGTFSQMAVNTGAYVSTYGIAAVGAAAAFVDLRDYETVTIKNNVRLDAFGNVNLTPGQDPGGNFRTVLISGLSDAQAYVRGLIAVPDAIGRTELTTDSNLVIGTDSYIGAGQNVTLAAYEGSQSLESHGDAHGYFLFLIPVTVSDSDRIPHQSSKIAIGDRTNVVAGQYHEQTVTIDCGASACTSGSRPSLTVAAGGAPLSWIDYTDPNKPLFDVVAYINSRYDPDVKDVLLSSVAGSPVPAFQIGPLFASGGSVTIDARTLAGSGTITAYGSPKINVTANSPAYLIFSGAYIPDLVGGQVNFTGAAGESSKPAGMVIDRQAGDGLSKITLVNNFTGQTGSTGAGPAMLFDGDVTNLGGTITINNLGGSYGTVGNTNAQGIDLNVPNGAAVISNPGPGGYYGPVNAFGGFDGLAVLYPGGQADRYDNTPNSTWTPTLGANIAAEYVANILYQGHYTGSTDAEKLANMNGAIYGFLNAGSEHFFAGTEISEISTLFFSNCVPGAAGACTSSPGYTPNWSVGTNFIVTPGLNIPAFGIYVPGQYLMGNLGNRSYFERAVPFRSLTYSSNNVSLPATNLVTTFGGGNVAIKAAVIDINAKIVIGRPAEQTVTIPQSVEATLVQYRTDYLNASAAGGSLPNPVHDIPGLLSALDAATQGRGTAVYDASSSQIIITDTNASSSGGRLTMNGAIISTSTAGNIEVNGGLGQVTIDNQTSISMVVNKVNTGSLGTDGTVVSTVKITDTLRPTATNTTTYLYTAGQGVLTYVTGNGDDPVLTGPNATAPLGALNVSGNLQYTPVPGARLQWAQQAELTRSLDNAGAGQWSWVMPGDQPNNPWMFVSGAALTNPSYDATQKTASGDLVSQAHPQGIVTIGNPNDAKYKQTITGGITSQTTYQENQYDQGRPVVAGFDGNSPVVLYYFSGFAATGIASPFAATSAHGWSGDSDQTGHIFNMPTALWLKVTSSVKADNPFNVSFRGGTVGSVSITSSAPVTLADQLTNSSGTTRITAAGSITQGVDAFVRTRNLILDATGGQGATANNATSGIGAKGTPFAATLNGGVVNATAGSGSSGGIYMDISGSATTGKVAAVDANGYGDIEYTQHGNLFAAGGADAVPINFIGNNITLSSIGGAIGTGAAPIVISANSSLDQNGAAVGGKVDMNAQGDINFRQRSETPGGHLDLRLGTVTSQSGDVMIEVTNGALVDARGLTAGDALSQDQVDAISQLLHLTAADGAGQAAIDRSVTPFEKLITSNYNRYFRMKGDACTANCTALEMSAATLAYYRPLAQAGLGVANADLTDAMVTAYIATLHEKDTYVLSDAALALYRPLALAALGSGATTVTDAQVRAYADAQYLGIARDFRRAFGDDWAALSRFATPGYASYLTLRGQNCTANCATFSVSDAALAFYRPLAAAALNVATPTDVQVRDYITTAHNKYGSVNLNGSALDGYRAAAQSAIGGADPVTDADVRAYADARFQGLATTYTFAVTDTEAASGLLSSLTDRAVWDPAQIVAGIDRTAFQPASPVVGNATPNIVGRNVTLTVGGGIGVLAAPVSVGLNSLIDGGGGAPLTNAQKAAIAAANTPGAVTVVGTDSQGQTVRGFSISDIPAGVTVTGVEINRQAPIFVSASETFTATASAGAAFVQSTGAPDLTVGQVTATGDVALTSPKSILVAVDQQLGALFAQQVKTFGNLTLTAGSGNIGAAGRAFTYAADGNLVAAQASGSVYLDYAGGLTGANPKTEMTIGRVFADQTASLNSSTGGISGYLPGLAITAHDIWLNAAAGDIGAPGSALNVRTDGGALTGTASGSASINSPTVDGQIPAPLTVASLAANGAITVTGDFDLVAQNVTSANGDILIGSAGNTTVTNATVTAQTGNASITVTALGDLETGTLTAPGQVKAQAGSTQMVTVSGTLTSRTDGVEILGGAVAMQAGSSAVADKTAVVTAQNGDATVEQLISAAGDIAVTAAGQAKIVTATVQGGSGGITANAGADLDLGNLTAPGRVSVQAGGALTVGLGKAITSLSDAIDVAAASLAMQANSLMSAAKTIAVTTLGDAIVGKLISTFASPTANTPVITVAAGDATHAGQIQGNGDGQTNFTVTRPNSAVTLAASNGMGTESQPLTVDTPWLSATATQGDIHIKSLGDVHVRTLAGPGKLDLTTTGALIFDEVKGDDIVLQSNGKLDVGNVEVTSSVQLIGTEIVGTVVQTPGSPGPLMVTIMGPNGTLAKNAVVVIDPPATIIPQLLAVDATITNIGPSFTVQYGYVSGQFTLLMNGQTFVMNNRSPAPLGGVDVQLYQQGSPFYFSQNGIRTYTSGYVVNYGLGVDPTALSLFNGMSFTRDVPRDMWSGSPFDDKDDGGKKPSRLRKTGLSPQAMLDGFRIPRAVQKVGEGPAVNIEGLQ